MGVGKCGKSRVGLRLLCAEWIVVYWVFVVLLLECRSMLSYDYDTVNGSYIIV